MKHQNRVLSDSFQRQRWIILLLIWSNPTNIGKEVKRKFSTLMEGFYSFIFSCVFIIIETKVRGGGGNECLVLLYHMGNCTTHSFMRQNSYWIGQYGVLQEGISIDEAPNTWCPWVLSHLPGLLYLTNLSLCLFPLLYFPWACVYPSEWKLRTLHIFILNRQQKYKRNTSGMPEVSYFFHLPFLLRIGVCCASGWNRVR